MHVKYYWFQFTVALRTIYMKQELGKSVTVAGFSALMIDLFWQWLLETY